jgi:hypothetical protein
MTHVDGFSYGFSSCFYHWQATCVLSSLRFLVTASLAGEGERKTIMLPSVIVTATTECKRSTQTTVVKASPTTKYSTILTLIHGFGANLKIIFDFNFQH